MLADTSTDAGAAGTRPGSMPGRSPWGTEANSELARRELRLLQLAFGFLLLTSTTLTLAGVADGRSLLASLQHWVALPCWLSAAWLLRRSLGRSNPARDPLLLPLMLLLCGWGLLIVWRLAPRLGARQTAWFLVGVLVLAELLRTPRDLGWLRRYRYLWLVGGLALTALTLVFGTNPAGGEPRLWLGCCGIYLQPSEPLRLLLIVFVAAYLSDKMLIRLPVAAVEPESDAGEGSGSGRLPVDVGRDLLPLAVAAAVSGLLLIAQRDLGTAVLFLTLLAFLVYFAYGHFAVLAAAAGIVLAGGAIGYLTMTLVQTRLDAWLNPWADPTGAGYQIVQSIIAIASGGVLGSGAGMGAPNAVPVVQSDFVFSAVAEEWGMVGAVALLSLFALLVGRGLRIAARSREPFVVLLAGGISVALGLQVLLIVAGVTRLLPITGVTLPLISYGGSSLVTNLLGLGFLLLLSRQQLGPRSRYATPILRTQNLFTAGWVACALVVGWWGILRADALVARTDNPRRALGSLESRRGEMLDRSNMVLATTVGEAGSYARSYPVPEAAPVIGYDSPVYGQTGLERTMDGYLRGEIGPDPLAIWWHEQLYGVPPAGSDLRLTLDAGLQRAAVEQLGDRAGAAIVIDPGSGELLAMASAPGFDPNLLDQQWPELLQRLDAPLLNRAANGYYQPGMVLAPLLFAWGVSEQALDPLAAPAALEQQIELFGQQFGCQQPVPPGTEPSWNAALDYACAGPFAALGEQLGERGLEAAMSAYGLRQAAELRLETVELTDREVPEEFDRLRQAGAAIGQGELLVTPLQVARAYSALAAAGVRPGASIVAAIRPAHGKWQDLLPLGSGISVVSPRAAQIALDAMGAGGTGNVGYQATALSGARSASWYVAIRQADRVVVVVLEDASIFSAREIGRALLNRR